MIYRVAYLNGHVHFTGVFLAFRFITGFCGSAFLSVAGGSISDLFSNATVATSVDHHFLAVHSDTYNRPMAIYAISPLIGPAVAPFISGFVLSFLLGVSLILNNAADL